MRVSRPMLVAAAAWLVVVAVGSTLVWAVISRAGDGVVSADQPVTSQGPTGQSTGPSAGPTTLPTTRPTITEDPTDSGSPSSPSASDSGSASPPGDTTPVRRTWQGLGGTVSVTCRGATASLDSAQPNSGFSVEVRERGPRRVEVRFEGDESESRVRATCASGAPVFEIDTD